MLAKLVARPLSVTEIDELWQKSVSALSKLEGLKKIILFGSGARRSMTEASDLDLVLIFDEGVCVREIYRQLVPMRRKIGWPCDFICVDEKQFAERSQIGGVLFIAREDGRVIYERKTNEPV